MTVHCKLITFAMLFNVFSFNWKFATECSSVTLYISCSNGWYFVLLKPIKRMTNVHYIFAILIINVICVWNRWCIWRYACDLLIEWFALFSLSFEYSLRLFSQSTCAFSFSKQKKINIFDGGAVETSETYLRIRQWLKFHSHKIYFLLWRQLWRLRDKNLPSFF